MSSDSRPNAAAPTHHMALVILSKLFWAGLGLGFGLAVGLAIGVGTGLIPFVC